MILARLRNDHDPEIVKEGTESELVSEIRKLGLTDYHDAYFYKNYEDLGLLDEDHYDYYCMYSSEEEMHEVLDAQKTKVVVGMDMDGHFHAIQLKNRKLVINHITEHLEDHFADEGDVALEEAEVDSLEDLMNCSFEQYKAFVDFFIQRGSLEITELK